MNDVVDKATRSRMMSGIRGKNTRPELVIRSALHARGYRFRLHRKGLPGKPDIVLSKYAAAVFVNGCFWHGHDCHLFKWPSTRQEFWREKIEGNRARDQRALGDLNQLGWRTARVWECALKGPGRLTVDVVSDQLCSWLESGHQAVEIRGTR